LPVQSFLHSRVSIVASPYQVAVGEDLVAYGLHYLQKKRLLAVPQWIFV
jgi:hypothetical protein